MELEIDVKETDGIPIMVLAGEIDVYTAPTLERKGTELIGPDSGRIVMNLQKVDFMDSSGLGVLVGLLKRAQSYGGEIVLCELRKNIYKVFQITGLDHVFKIFSSCEEAVEYVGAREKSR